MKLINRLATELSIEEHIPSPKEAKSTFLNYWYDIFFFDKSSEKSCSHNRFKLDRKRKEKVHFFLQTLQTHNRVINNIQLT